MIDRTSQNGEGVIQDETEISPTSTFFIGAHPGCLPHWVCSGAIALLHAQWSAVGSTWSYHIREHHQTGHSVNDSTNDDAAGVDNEVDDDGDKDNEKEEEEEEGTSTTKK